MSRHASHSSLVGNPPKWRVLGRCSSPGAASFFIINIRAGRWVSSAALEFREFLWEHGAWLCDSLMDQ